MEEERWSHLQVILINPRYSEMNISRKENNYSVEQTQNILTINKIIKCEYTATLSLITRHLKLMAILSCMILESNNFSKYFLTPEFKIVSK